MFRQSFRYFSTKKELILINKKNNVTTITMNNPEKLNGWNQDMLSSLFLSLKNINNDNDTKVIILTGSGKFYCAGVDLSSSFTLKTPKNMLNEIIQRNELLFNVFLDRKKPMIIAVNGPAIGASVTSATLCDAIIASEKATFLTPFGRLGITPEGCSSVHFDYLIGSENAKKMLFQDWQPSAKEAKDIGLITEVVPHEQLIERAQTVAETWIQEGKHLQPLTAMGYKDFEHLKRVNAEESIQLGHAFLSEKFLAAQVKFLKSKNKNPFLFELLLFTRRIWSKMLY